MTTTHTPVPTPIRKTAARTGAALALALLTAGPPWALCATIGWPLTHHLPSTTQLARALSSPPGTALLLHLGACAAWLIWAAFLADTLTTLRHPRSLHRIAGRRSLAALLLTVIAAGPAALPALAAPPTHRPQAAPSHPQSRERHTGARTVTVQAPHDGVYDSLWRIAERTLGDGDRWPEIYRLNRGCTQADGRTLTTPGLIRPGWILVLPATTTSTQKPSRPTSHTPKPSTTPASPSPATTRSATEPRLPAATPSEQTTTPAWPSTARPHDRPGGVSPTAAVLAATLAAAFLAAGTALRRHTQHRTAKARPPRRGTTTAPKIRPLAYIPASPPKPAPAPPPTPRRPLPDPDDAVAMLATTRGISITGPGTRRVLRALLHRLTHQAPSSATPHIIIAPLADDLLDAASLPHAEHATGLDAALDTAEAVLAERANNPGTATPPLTLVAEPDAAHARRLQALIEGGPALGVTGILTGTMPPLPTVRVDATGHVTAATGAAESLAGTRLDTLTPVDESHRTPAPPATRPANELATPTPPTGPDPRRESTAVTLTVLGHIHATVRTAEGATQDLALAPKHREVLAYLALHRDGAHKDHMLAALWPDAPIDRPANAFHATISQIRQRVHTHTSEAPHPIIEHHDDTYRLNATAFDVDLWHVTEALAKARATGDATDRLAAIQAAIAAYPGDFATDVNSEWAETPREALRRDLLDGLTDIATQVASERPADALDLLEHALRIDPYNEGTYATIARVQAACGKPDAISRTLHLAATALAEIDEQPSRHLIELCERLQADVEPR